MKLEGRKMAAKVLLSVHGSRLSNVFPKGTLGLLGPAGKQRAKVLVITTMHQKLVGMVNEIATYHRCETLVKGGDYFYLVSKAVVGGSRVVISSSSRVSDPRLELLASPGEWVSEVPERDRLIRKQELLGVVDNFKKWASNTKMWGQVLKVGGLV